MARTYTYATTLTWGGDTPTAEIEVLVSYEITFGTPESGRFGPPEHYDPGSGDEVHSIKVLTVDGKAADWAHYMGDADLAKTIVDKIEADDDLRAEMVAEASETEVADEDAADEARWEERRLEGGF